MTEPSIIETASSDNQMFEPLPVAAAHPGLASEGVDVGSEPPPCAGPSGGITSSRTQKPVAADAEPSVPPSSPGIPSSPTSSEADSLHDVESLSGDWLAQTTNAAYDTRFFQAASHPDKELAGLHESGSDRDARSVASPREQSPQRDGPSHLNPAFQAEEWDKKDPLSPQAPRSRPTRGTQLGQRRTRSSERLPATPTTALSRELSELVRALEQDGPGSQESMSPEAEQETPGPIRDTACGKAATEIARAELPGSDASPLLAPNHPDVPLRRPDDGAHRETRPTLAPVSRGDRGEQDSRPLVKRKRAHGSTAVRHGTHHRTDSFDINAKNAEADGMQQPLVDVVTLPQRRKRRRVSSQRERRLRRQDAEDTGGFDEDSSDEWVARLPRRRRGGPPQPVQTTAAAPQTLSDSETVRLQQVQTPGNSKSVEALSAKFAEWLSGTADVRKAEVDGATIFQLRFYCSNCKPAVLSNPHSNYTSNTPAVRHNSTLGHAPSGDVPPALNRLFSQVEEGVESPPLSEYEADWEVEEIVAHRKRGRGWQVRVKWAHFQNPTWEPRTNFLGKDVLLAYEAQHGQIAP